jgi:hypothetical protein
MIHFIIHRDDFQGENFEASMELWIEVLSSYLIIEENEK